MECGISAAGIYKKLHRGMMSVLDAKSPERKYLIPSQKVFLDLREKRKITSV